MLSVAIRLIKIKLQVTKIEPPGSGDEGEEDDDDGMDWSNFHGERLPVVHFRGNSRSLHASWDPNANSKIRGQCSAGVLYMVTGRLMYCRHGPANTRRRDPLDNVLNLPRRRAVALRGHPGGRDPQRKRRARELV